MCMLLVMRAMLVIFANGVEANGNPNAHLPQSESILILVTFHSHFYPNVKFMVPKKGFVNGLWEGIPKYLWSYYLQKTSCSFFGNTNQSEIIWWRFYSILSS